MEETMRTTRKNNQTAKLFKGILFVAFLALASGCGGGGTTPGRNMASENGGPVTAGLVNGGTVEGAALARANQVSTKLDLCAEVNGWATDCRFVGMKYLKQADSITPLTEKFSGKNRGRGGRA